MDDVVGTLVFVVIVNVKDGRASKLRLRIRGAAPGAGESRFAFPSDCFAWSCRDNAFDVRGGVSDDERDEVCPQLVAARRRLEPEWAAGNKSGVARWVPGRTARLSIGGVGGGRMLALTPEPVLRPS